MTRRNPRNLALGVLFLAAGLVLAGCFTTELNLGSATDAKVDVAYCGQWHFTWKDGDKTKSAELVVANFDGKQYYVEWREQDPNPLRMSGFLVPVKTAVFAQVSPLEEDKGELARKHIILRVKLEGDKLTLRHLNEDFFKDVKTDGALRKLVEENLDNNAMYEEGGSGTGSRVAQEK